MLRRNINGGIDGINIGWLESLRQMMKRDVKRNPYRFLI
jgi:hypothetical protein